MAHVSSTATPELPCDNEGNCMVCKTKPTQEETLPCNTCGTSWHVTCLLVTHKPESLLSSLQWVCPDCSSLFSGDSVGNTGGNELVAAVKAIEADESLTELEKAKKRQKLLSKGVAADVDDEEEEKRKRKGKGKFVENDVLGILDESFNCSFCMQLPERPVTTPCGHNFCLKCFKKWMSQGGNTCAKCRSRIPQKMASQPRINASLIVAIRMAKLSKSALSAAPVKVTHFVHNQLRPDKAFTTERAKKTGKANACSGKIFVTVPNDHFGPIPAENDPGRNQGVLVGECWEDRMECRQWGAHFPHVSGIGGQSTHGAQSVAISGGYQDDEDHGEWFLYTGSGGRDLTGNKRTNKNQSKDQTFDKSNEALRVSCKKGYPVRVVRSHKEKRSSYSPEAGLRYDGVYRIEKCWRKVGIQGHKVCRYLFIRCDNEPAPWTSDEHGDHPRPLPVIKELKGATDLFERKESPSWDYDEEDNRWKWKKPPPSSKRPVNTVNPEDVKRARKAIKNAHNLSVREKLLKEFSCLICRKVLNLPLTTPCAHNFCKPCLEGAFAGQTFVRERTCQGRRTLRTQKNIMKCPTCQNDISDFLKNPQVNRELLGVIESLQCKTEKENVEDLSGEESGGTDKQSETAAEDGNSERQNHTEVLQNEPECKPKRSYKRRKVNDEEQPDAERKSEPVSVGTEDDEMKVDVSIPCESKLKTEGGENTPTKVSEEVRNEGNDSPSSPLHVRSDGDD
ncbi:hypothetical protein IFM89_009098 [Coptis chinensis]|uniref:RING-type E3 ubiquitin transferase n=1 Tax=Coptis chinensis TaxID=261450 RepID=A0A835IKS9_9MAGN|nr:hypothetical protein IFM89_009098 [Coptis chinensis]